MKHLNVIYSILLALAVFVFGAALAVAFSEYGIGDGVFIALLLTPLLVFGVASGLVQEFTAPGGWGAKFRQAAKREITPMPLTEAIEDFQAVEKESLGALRQAGQRLDKNTPVALSLRFDRAQGYNERAVRQYLEMLSAADRDLAVIILDEGGKFVASADGGALMQLLNQHEDAMFFMNAMRGHDRSYFQQSVSFLTDSLATTYSNAEALERMSELNARIMAVTDKAVPVGFLRRENLMTKLLVELTGNAQ